MHKYMARAHLREQEIAVLLHVNAGKVVLAIAGRVHELTCHRSGEITGQACWTLPGGQTVLRHVSTTLCEATKLPAEIAADIERSYHGVAAPGSADEPAKHLHRNGENAPQRQSQDHA